MNPTLDLIERRRSTRVYADAPVSAADRAAILNAAFRAPTSGNLMLYSIIEVADQALKDRLAVTCDDQPFIAKAPLVLVFLADFQKWVDLFDASLAKAGAAPASRRAPGPGDLMMAACDAIIAAQNSVIAAESLGIGSCYIGDVLEQGEEHSQLLGVPEYAMPVAMLCFGHPASVLSPVAHYAEDVVHQNRYHRADSDALACIATDLQRMHAPHGLVPGAVDYPHAVYERKYATGFMDEMNRSVAWWLERWCRGISSNRQQSMGDGAAS